MGVPLSLSREVCLKDSQIGDGFARPMPCIDFCTLASRSSFAARNVLNPQSFSESAGKGIFSKVLAHFCVLASRSSSAARNVLNPQSFSESAGKGIFWLCMSTAKSEAKLCTFWGEVLHFLWQSYLLCVSLYYMTLCMIFSH